MAVRQRAKLEALEGVVDEPAIVGAPPAERTSGRRSTEHHDLAHGDGQVRRSVLRLEHVRHRRADLVRLGAEDPQRAIGGRQQAGDGVQERRFARAVRSDYAVTPGPMSSSSARTTS